jgi:lipopolysaccharide export system permease protein
MFHVQRYLFGQLLGPFAAILAGLTLVAMLTQSLSQMDLLIERGQSPLTLMAISALAAPQFMAVVCPIALFAAVASTYNRLHLDNELVIGSASGLGPWTLVEPAVRLSVLAMVAVLAVNLFVQPASYREMRDRLFEIRSDLATTLVREGQFRTPIDNLTIYVQRVDRSGGLTNLLVSDSRNPADLITYVAREGAVVRVEGQPAISMRNGSLQRRNAAGVIEMVGFSTYVLELGEFGGAPEAVLYKPSDRYLNELFSPDMTSYWDRTHHGELTAEAWKRLASPLLGLAAVLIALTAVIGATFSRKGYGREIAWASGQLVVLLLVSSAVFTLVEDNPELAPLQFAIPLVPALLAARRLGLFEQAPARPARARSSSGQGSGAGPAKPAAEQWDRVLEQAS